MLHFFLSFFFSIICILNGLFSDFFLYIFQIQTVCFDILGLMLAAIVNMCIESHRRLLSTSIVILFYIKMLINVLITHLAYNLKLFSGLQGNKQVCITLSIPFLLQWISLGFIKD